MVDPVKLRRFATGRVIGVSSVVVALAGIAFAAMMSCNSSKSRDEARKIENFDSVIFLGVKMCKRELRLL